MNNNVILIGTYGSDMTHAQSAWASTNKKMTEERVKRIPEFLKQLAKDKHETPFEKSMIHFNVTSDIASHIHLLKHRIGVSVNSESARYMELKGDKYYAPEDWPLVELERFEKFQTMVYQEYHEAIKRLQQVGFTRQRAKESARFYLTYANQLTQDVSFNFRSFVHFQKLRNSEYAQLEIGHIAQEMLRLVKECGEFKYSIEAFEL
jgi:flavin-dependent thymidylate synthase